VFPRLALSLLHQHRLVLPQQHHRVLKVALQRARQLVPLLSPLDRSQRCLVRSATLRVLSLIDRRRSALRIRAA
jgi:hypothetical protein